MARNGTGTYTPPSGIFPAIDGTVISASDYNTVVNDLASAMTGSLPRDGQAPMSGTLKLADGTSAAPGVAWNSDATTGLFRPITNSLAITAGGVEQVRWVGGNTLMGSTSDSGEKLQVTGTSKLNGAVNITGTTTITGAASISSTLAVTGATTLSSSLIATAGAFSGTISTVGAGASSDPYGRVSVTFPSDANSYGYYGLTRQGSIGWSFGVDNNNRLFFGTGSAQGTPSNVATRVLTIGTDGALTSASNVVANGSVTATGPGGFVSATYAQNQRNPIWRFGNSDPHGLSYFQGSAGISNNDTIGIHFGTATAAGSKFRFNANGSFEADGNVNAGSFSTGGTTTHAGDARSVFGPNSTWGAYLRVGGNGTQSSPGATIAQIATSDGNLHLDAGNNKAMYLNYNAGTAGINFCNGAQSIVATMNSGGTITAAGFVGPLSGNATSATSASNASTVNMSSGRTDGSAYPVVWGVESATSQIYSCSAVRIISSIGQLSANRLCAGPAVATTTGDMSANRGDGTGVIFLADSAHYLYFNGANYNLNSGGLIVTGDITAFSDKRVKTDIEVIPDALNKVKKIRGVTFRRIDGTDDGKRHAGLIAQEVEKVLPEVVSETVMDPVGKGRKRKLKTVAYGNTIALLVEAVKELTAKVEALEAK